MEKKRPIKVKEDTLTVTMRHFAYSDGKEVGHADSVLFKEEAGLLNQIRAKLTLSDVKDLNRQRMTDDKNSLRRGTSLIATLKQAVKKEPKLTKIVEVLVTQAQSGKLDVKAIESIAKQLGLG